jgi:putative ABC transport system ATP-binding protein
MRVSINDLVVEYTSGDYAVRPIDGLALEAGEGELILLLGASGCGKTTLLSVLAGILTPTEGTVVVDGTDVRKLDRAGMARYRQGTVGIVFQAFNLVPSLTALENVIVPMRLGGVSRAEAKRRATALLAQVGLEDRMHHLPADMSGGQQQRVAIARSLAHDPPVLLADEPTAHLDYLQVEGVVKLLRDLADAGRTIVVATHDDRLLPLADRVVELTPRFQVDHVGRRHRTLDKGEVLFRQGEPSDLVYMVDAGRLQVVRELTDGSEETLATVGPGQFTGELGPLLGLQRSATVRAEVRTQLTAYTATEFRSKVQGQPAAEVVPAKKPAAKKPAAKKAPTKKAAPRTAVAKKAPPKKAGAKKATAKKAAPARKAAARKTTGRRVAAPRD